MISFPNAKINLGLQITAKRPDGYHAIESCFYPIPWTDVLEIIPSKTFRFSAHGLPIPGNSNSNLCIKAYELLKERFQIEPVSIHLLKNIPMGAGLGGGSADGAFTINMLDELFELRMSIEEKELVALELGSDCPFFIQNKPAIAKGRGEILSTSSVNLKSFYLAICNPGIHISTQEAYSGISPALSEQSIETVLQNHEDWQTALKNDFEASIFEKHPAIKNLKEEMISAGAFYASMTGSGSTVFGLFKNPINHPNWKTLQL